MTKEKKTFRHLTSKEVCHLYELLHSVNLVSFPLTGDAVIKLDSLTANINGINFYVPNYKTTTEKIIAYLYFIVKDHPFIDGNKRTASLAFFVLCDINQCVPDLSNFTLDELVVALEGYQGNDFHTLIKDTAELLFSS